jgi:hypothetical protein
VASITPKNGRVAFITNQGPHTYWELNTTNLGTNYGDDSSGVSNNTSVLSGDIVTSGAYEGLGTNRNPPISAWFDSQIVTDACMLLYIPAGLTHSQNYGIWHNGGGTNAQAGLLRATATGVEIACLHNNVSQVMDVLIEEIPDADLPGWFSIGFQFASNGGVEGDMGLWVNGSLVRSGTRVNLLDYGSGNPYLGATNSNDPNAASVIDPVSYAGGDWGGDLSITGTGILIANFTVHNPAAPTSTDTSGGSGDTFYTDYNTDHVDAGTAFKTHWAANANQVVSQ